MLQVRLWQVGRLMPPRLAAHLEERGCLPVLYMSSWLLTVFASAFPLSFASRVMDVLLTDSYSEPMMRVRRAGAVFEGAVTFASTVQCL
jgi:Rab-GTPase-TBC domain